MSSLTKSGSSSKRATFGDVSSGGSEGGREMRFEIRSRFAKVGIEMEVEGKRAGCGTRLRQASQ